MAEAKLEIIDYYDLLGVSLAKELNAAAPQTLPRAHGNPLLPS